MTVAGTTVGGTHAYTEEGTFTASVYIQDDGGSEASGQVTVNVADAPISVSVQGPPNPIEGQALNNAVVGTVTDTNPNAPVGDFSGTIDWGDGPNGDDGTSTSAATFQAVDGQPGTFNILGSHTYAEEGGYDMVVSVNDAGGSSDTSSNMFNVADAPISLVAGDQVNATEGITTPVVTVATVMDTNPNAPASDFNGSTINWGDGNSSPASLAGQGGGTFLLQGSHLYAEEGQYTITVTANDVGGSNADPVTLLADVQDAPISLTPQPVTAIEGLPSGVLTVATLQDTNLENTDNTDFSGTFNYGDGTAGPLTFVPQGGGLFAVQVPSHVYLEEGNYSMALTVTDVGGAPPASTTITAQVADAPLNGTAVNGITTPNVAFSGTIANFTDTDPNGTLTDYATTVDWGDGSSPDTPVLAASGLSWDVRGTHTYATAGVYTATITVVDFGEMLGGARTVITSQVAVVPPMEVAKINHNSPSGFLSHAEETSPGAFVPLDNNDWDYNGTLDMQQSGPVPGDQYLLPVTLPALTGATAQDAYTLTASEGIKIYLGSDRSNPYTGTLLPATSDQIVYVEGVEAGGASAPQTLTENFSAGTTSRSNLDYANVIVFTLNGPLDVPGSATYTYTNDLSIGSWTDPDGGTRVQDSYVYSGSNLISSSESIKWDNTPEVGYGLYQVNTDYTWGIGVNVVAITLDTAHMTITTPSLPYADPTYPAFIHSAAAGSDAMDASIPVTIQGPFVNGVQRGVHFIQVGFIQDATFTAQNTVYGAAGTEQSSIQGPSVYVDWAHFPSIPGYGSAFGPWYDDSGNRPNAYLNESSDPTTSSPIHQTMMVDDTPALMATDPALGGGFGAIHGAAATMANLILNFNLYLAVATTDTTNNANTIFTERAAGAWVFNGSGTIVSGTWTAIPTVTGDSVASQFSEVSDGTTVPVTTGSAALDMARGETWAIH